MENPDETKLPKLIRAREILLRFQIHRETLRRWEKDGFFPKGIVVRRGVKVWSEEEVVDFWKKLARSRA